MNAVKTPAATYTAQHAHAASPLAWGGWRRMSTIQYPPAEATVGQKAPDFTAPAIIDGDISQVKLSDYYGNGKWTILFWYPKDFTFVCPTEIIAFSDRAEDFQKVNTNLIAASTDTEESHLAWIKLPRKKGGLGHMKIPIVADTTKEIASKYGVLLKDAGIALRGQFIIDPEGTIQQIVVNNLGIGRSVDEALRVVQAAQFVAEHGEVCPADWQPGSKSMKADADGSLEYFSSLEEAGGEEVDFGKRLRTLKSSQEYEDFVSSGTAVVDFIAPWCGKCRQIAPHIEQLQDEHSNVKFAKVDTTDSAMQQLCQDLGIKALPAFKFFKDGKEAVDEVTGYKKQKVDQALQSLL